jgi:hypothetical protein
MEEIGELIGKGFAVWRRNLNLCIPFLLSVILSMIVTLPFLAGLFLTSLPVADINATMLQNDQDMQELISQMQSSLDHLDAASLLPIAGLFLVWLVVLSLINAFFTAGAIGMARHALDEGKSDSSSMWSAGKSNFFNMFLATLLVGLLTLVGLIFFLPVLAQQTTILSADSQTIGLVAAGLILFVLYALVLSVVLVAMPYALVIEKLGPMQAVLASVDFFRYNKFDVAILWLVVVALSLGMQMVGGVFSAGEQANGTPLSALYGLVNILVLAPLSNLWWTRLYMNRKGMLKVDEVNDPW